ncbi:hypothetical protein ACFFX0_03315 [Citricoccus parietis]|uniref:Uncharacterized protein n=1 Tax=Citricoccus parietis TaxID=592307 RepID=A0ABV5FUA2_9MICC
MSAASSVNFDRRRSCTSCSRRRLRRPAACLRHRSWRCTPSSALHSLQRTACLFVAGSRCGSSRTPRPPRRTAQCSHSRSGWCSGRRGRTGWENLEPSSRSTPARPLARRPAASFHLVRTGTWWTGNPRPGSRFHTR